MVQDEALGARGTTSAGLAAPAQIETTATISSALPTADHMRSVRTSSITWRLELTTILDSFLEPGPPEQLVPIHPLSALSSVPLNGEPCEACPNSAHRRRQKDMALSST